jgi:chlorite dismutase
MGESSSQAPDIAEHGAGGQRSDRRLFMQLLAFGDCMRPEAVSQALDEAGIDAVVYADFHDPMGIAVLTMSEDPAFFMDTWRPMLRREPFTELTPKPKYTMVGRSYALGYEKDLQQKLITMPRSRALNPDWPWAVWYPLRRSGAFTQLPEQQQKAILKEHGTIGMAFGAADYAHDIRLKCHGLDTHDNDFVVGLLGKDLYPLSAVVERMRSTEQTSQYLTSLGPFFVGRVLWQSQNQALSEQFS